MRYEPDGDGILRSSAHRARGGAMRWRTSAGDEVAANLGEPTSRDLRIRRWFVGRR